MIPRKEKGLRTTKELGTLVRETRKAQGISQEQLARCLPPAVKVPPPEAVEEVAKESEQNGQEDGGAMEAVA